MNAVANALEYAQNSDTPIPPWPAAIFTNLNRRAFA